jgi:hypothetical protein
MSEKTQSEQINELATALAKAQGEIMPAIKDSKNPFFKSSYADLSSIWTACKEPLSKNGLAIMQTMDVKEGQQVLITTLAHSSGQWIRSFLPILSEKNNAQGIGSAITYMRRYGLSAMIGITSDDDDDGNEACKQSDKKKEVFSGKISRDQAEEIKMMLAQCDEIYVQNVRNYYHKNFRVESWEQLPSDQHSTLYRNISNKLSTQKSEMVGVL